jgi:hypothetical protein
MELLQELRCQNPDLNFCEPRDLKHLRLGEVVPMALSESWITFLESGVPMPESGTVYVPSVAGLEATSEFATVVRHCYGEMPLQFGYCMGFNSRLNALEWHKGSELVVAITDLLLLLDRKERIDPDGWYAPTEMRAVPLSAGTVVELYAGTLHFAPLQVRPSGFRAGIILPRETNLPLSTPPSPADPFLWARNKWLVAHPESPQAQRGARVGIRGMNTCLQGLK